MNISNYSFCKETYKLLKGYWTSEEKWKAIGLLALALGINFGYVYISVRMNYWNRDFFNAIQELNQELFIKQIYIFFLIIIPFTIVYITRDFITSLLSFLWRKWLTKNYIKKWGDQNVFYHVMSNQNHIDNPDQRIANDLAQVPEGILSLFIAVIGEIAKLISFIAILWGLSSDLILPFFGKMINIPGYLVWAAILYALAGTIATFFTGKKLVLLDFTQEKLEANFRTALIRIQEKREEIAFYEGMISEERSLLEKFGYIRDNFIQIIKRKIYVNTISVLYVNLSKFIPIIICAPMYFTKMMTFGVLMQISNAFTEVKDSFSIVVDNFIMLASLKASLNRLIEFNKNVKEAKHKISDSKIKIEETDNKIIQIKNLKLDKPSGENILSGFNLDLKNKQKVMLTGASGSGKTTLIRAIKGLWCTGSGEVTLSNNTMFISQKPFLPINTLLNAITYPQAGSGLEQFVEKLLDEYHLSHLKSELTKIKDWSNVLSLGEQQRIALIRVILHNPDVVIMDEPSSSLDEGLEKTVMKDILTKLKDKIFLVISHSENLKPLFDEIINIEKYK